MKLTKNFTLKELTRSDTAQRKKIDNTPPQSVIVRLELLSINILQPLRDHFGPVVVNSGYRCPLLNETIGGATKSQHMLGQAADIEIRGYSNLEVAKWIRVNLKFDKCILEFYNPADPRSGWVHVSYRGVHNRGETYRIGKNGTQAGFE